MKKSYTNTALFLFLICSLITTASFGQSPAVQLSEQQARRGIEIFDQCDKFESENEVLKSLVETLKAERDTWKSKYQDKQNESEWLRLAIIEKDKGIAAQGKIIDLQRPKSRFLAGLGVGGNLTSTIFQANVDFMSKKNDIYGVGVDNYKRVYLRYSRTIFSF